MSPASTSPRPSGARLVRGLALAGAALVAAFIASLSGCTHVRPYERERLAHPTMTTGEWSGPAAMHARAVREGATGGGTAGEAGCGCN